LNTRLFDFNEASQSAGWVKELNNEHVPESEEYGISSFVFRDKRPFHPDRFLNYVTNNWPGSIIRIKGLFCLSSRPDHAISWSQACGSLKADVEGYWWVAIPRKQRLANPAFIHNMELIKSKWDSFYGDRMNELVIIGQDLEKEIITKELQSCLCTFEEIEGWKQKSMKFSDNWPMQ
jgi:G3E family GTPase